MMFNGRSFSICRTGCGLVFVPASHFGHNRLDPSLQQSVRAPIRTKNSILSSVQRTDEDKFKAQKEVRQELKGAYKTWLDQDVAYIISDEERRHSRTSATMRSAKHLSSSSGCAAIRTRTLRQRVSRRALPANPVRQRPLAAGKPGWKTDRGHIYISFGPPDSIESHPSGGTYQRPMDEGGGETATFPFETWHYRYHQGIGENIDLEFVDTCQCGDYHFTIDRSEKDALLKVPGAGLTQWEEMGQAKKADRFKGGFESLGTGPMASSPASQAVRPHRTGREDFCASADQVQGS